MRGWRPMEITYRPARREDVPELADLYLEAVSDLLARFNTVAELTPRATVLRDFEHNLATGICQVAAVEGMIAAVAAAIVRDHLWYLTAYWTRPALQRQGIGLPLLRKVWQSGQEAGATTFFTWSSSDAAALASYLRLGLYPGYQILRFAGAPQQLPPLAPRYSAARLESSQATAVDREILGTRRPADHRFWAESCGLRGRQVLRDGEVVGYYYLDQGSIGPLAWRAAQDGQAVLTLACREAAEQAPQVQLAVPGINHAALRFAVDAGLRLAGFAHFLTSAPFGRLEQYLPSGPALF